jgi:hypothetical protein
MGQQTSNTVILPLQNDKIKVTANGRLPVSAIDSTDRGWGLMYHSKFFFGGLKIARNHSNTF